jgi:hypothetical protein
MANSPLTLPAEDSWLNIPDHYLKSKRQIVQRIDNADATKPTAQFYASTASTSID